MTFLRSALFNLYFFGLTFVLAISGMMIRLVAPIEVMPLAMLWARCVVEGARRICGIQVEVSGREIIPLTGPALIASRHQSAFDTIVWLTLVPRCCYVVKRELLRVPLYGSLLRQAGMISIDRAGGGAAIRHLLREADRAMREERQVVIFPEGTRAEPGTMLPLQPGVAALAARTGLPVIPVVTDSGLCWGRRAFNKRAGVIHIRILPPIAAGTPREKLMQELNAALQNEIDEMGPAVDKIVE
jgi:1-acyl-sn-glycerol-3-phosphate acyltransferase